jgi:N4-gp56 family major capsid protein
VAAPDNPLTPPSANNVSPLTADDVASLTGTYGITAVGARDVAGLPTGPPTDVDSLVTRAYDLLAHAPLRDNLVFDRYATVRPTRQSHNGAVVQLTLIPDITDASATALLDAAAETYDVMPTKLSSFTMDLRMFEYGRVVTTTNQLRAWASIPVDPVAAERIGRNAGSTIDRVALAAVTAAGGIQNTGTAGLVPNAVTPVAGKPSATLRAAAEYFQVNNVQPFANGLYAAIIRPAAYTALRAETDAAGWRYWQANNSDAGDGEIRRRRIEEYEGFSIEVSNRLVAGAVDVFMGAEGLAKVYPMTPGFSAQPQTVVAPVVDRLRRFASVGWYWLGGYGRFRAEAIQTGNLTA